MLAGLQRLGPWLFGLFLIAQVGGVLPLVYVHAVHDYGHHDVIAVSVAVGTSITAVASGTLSNPDQGIAASPWTTISAVRCCTGWSERFRSPPTRR